MKVSSRSVIEKSNPVACKEERCLPSSINLHSGNFLLKKNEPDLVGQDTFLSLVGYFPLLMKQCATRIQKRDFIFSTNSDLNLGLGNIALSIDN